jgi:NADP-dependent 3-hydroxy acid dehydrogenase YdfG
MTIIKQQPILITGATSGIGLALAIHLKKMGYIPIASGRNDESLAELSAKYDILTAQIDVSDTKSCADKVAQIERDFGPLGGLINNAGIWLEGEFIDYSMDQIENVINVNMMGTIAMTHAALPKMVERGHGTIINVVSTGGLYCRKHISIYAASKWAIRGFTGCLTAEYAPLGVRVMGFYPGKVDSKLYENAGINRNLDIALSPDQTASMIEMMLRDPSIVWSDLVARSINDYG